jgi:anion transporter
MTPINQGESAAATIALPQVKATDVNGIIRLLLGPLVALVVWVAPIDIDPIAHKAIAISVFVIMYWVMEPVEHAITAVTGCYLCWALQIVPVSVAFSGFASGSVWFLFGGLLIGQATSQTGIAQRLGYVIMRRTGTSYPRLLFGMITFSFVLNLLIPSALARVSVMASIAIGIIGACGLGKQSNLGKGLFLILTFTSPLFGKMMIASPSGILTRGMIEQAGAQIFWSQWLLAFLPIILVTIFSCWILVRWLCPAELADLPSGRQYFHDRLQEMGPLSRDEKKTLCWVLLAMALWTTDLIHHINPAVITLGIGVILALPKIGVLDENAIKKINFFSILFSAGALSMSNVLTQTKSLAVLTDRLADWLPPLLSNAFSSAVTLYWGGFIYHLFIGNDQSMVSSSLPILLSVAQVNGYNPATLGLIWVFAASATLFMYQSGPLVLGYSYGYFTAKDLFKVAAIMTIVEGILLMAVVPLYWPLIGLNWIR